MEFLNTFYNRYLVAVEVVVIYALTAVVTTLGLFTIIYRNFISAGWDVAWVNDAVFGLTYYLCLTGAIVASRKADHISIDILSHLVPEKYQDRLIGAGLLIASVSAFYLSGVAVDYINNIVMTGADAAHVAPWRKPLVPFFALIGFHLAIQSILRLTGNTPEVEVMEHRL